MLGVNEHMGLKLFGREIIFEEFQTYSITVPKRYRRMDRGRTDDTQSHNRALRGKKQHQSRQ